jgi:hypothetical protein
MLHRYRFAVVILLATTSLLAAVPAQAQRVVCRDTANVEDEEERAAKLLDCREEKSERLRSPTPGFFEQVSGFVSSQPLLEDFPVIDVELPVVPGLRPVLGGLRSGSGLTGGLRYEPLRGGNPAYFVLSGRASLKRYWGVRSILGYDTGGYQVYGFGTYQHIPQDRFYGIGPETKEDFPDTVTDTLNVNEDIENTARSNYRWDRGIAGALVGFRPVEGLLIGAHGAYQRNRLGEGKADWYPDLRAYEPFYRNEFGRATPGVVSNGQGGFEIVDVDYLMAGAYAEYDSRVIYSAEEGTLDLPRNPLYRNRFAPITDRVQGISLDADRGVYLAGQVIPHHDLTSSGSDEDYDFLRYELEAEEYIPFRHGYQVLAFREFMSVSQSLGEGDNIPFYMMDYIGGGSTIRGFDGFRFRDRNLAVANAEYRWEAWFRMDAALFVDAGYAFRDFDEFAFNEIETGYGFGFRFRSSRSVVARIDFAWSREGFSTYLKLGAFL